MSLSAIPKSLRDRVLRRDGGRCRYCQLSQIGQAAVFHVNHVIPKSRDGATEESNLVLQCPHCSLRKSDKLRAVDPASGEVVPLFDPLRQEWHEHFAIDASAICSGRTPIGRATVTAFRMNDPLPRIARALQIGLGLIAPS